MTSTDRARRLIRLYPRWWRERFGDELLLLIEDLDSAASRRWTVEVDLIRSALVARLRGQVSPQRRTAVSSGVADGVPIAAVLVASIFITNVLWQPQGSDAPLGTVASAGLLAIAMTAIGYRARRRSAETGAGAKAGAIAALLVAGLGNLTFLAVDNVFWSTVRQQHDKIVAFQASNWTDMRAYTNVSLLKGAAIAIPLAIIGGALLGWVGQRLTRDHVAAAS